MRRHRPTPDDVHVVTTAAPPLSVDQAARQRRYLYSMMIRTVCVLAAIVIPGWPRWVLIAAAIVLPYLAVIAANAGRENTDPPALTPPGPTYRPELPSSNGTT